GEINLPSAVQFSLSGSATPTVLSGELQAPSLIASVNTGVSSKSIVWGASGSSRRVSSESIVWGSAGSIVWGASDSFVWAARQSIVWGAGQSIVWRANP